MLVTRNQQRVTLHHVLKKYVVLIYRWMLVGGRLAPDMHFDTLPIVELINLYRHCINMDVAQLRETTAERIRLLLQNISPTVGQINHVYRNAKDFIGTVVQSTARLLANPLIFDAPSYYEYAEQWPEFNEALGAAMEEILLARRKTIESIPAKRKNRYKRAAQSTKANHSAPTDVSGSSPNAIT